MQTIDWKDVTLYVIQNSISTMQWNEGFAKSNEAMHHPSACAGCSPKLDTRIRSCSVSSTSLGFEHLHVSDSWHACHILRRQAFLGLPHLAISGWHGKVFVTHVKCWFASNVAVPVEVLLLELLWLITIQVYENTDQFNSNHQNPKWW